MKNRLSPVTCLPALACGKSHWRAGHLNSGQSLVEVIVSISIISLILIALVSAITFSMANALYTRNKTQATKYAQEAVEWMRNERDKDWTTFFAHTGTYCLRNITTWPSTGACSSTAYITGTTFIRQAVLTSEANKISAAVTVSWRQGSRTSQVVVNSILTKWE